MEFRGVNITFIRAVYAVYVTAAGELPLSTQSDPKRISLDDYFFFSIFNYKTFHRENFSPIFAPEFP